MSQQADGRCKAVTKKGERCKNLAFTRGCCRVHASEQSLSARDRIPLVAAVISSSAAMVTMLEKLIQHWPDILYIIESIVASTRFAGWRGVNTAEANSARLQALKSATVVGSFSNLHRLLVGPDRYASDLPELPPELKNELRETIERHHGNLASLEREREKLMDSIVTECRSYLERIVKKHGWLYQQYRVYRFSLMVDDLNARTEEANHLPYDAFEWSLSSFDENFPQNHNDFVKRHERHRGQWWFIDYINYLHFLNRSDPSSTPEQRAVWHATAPYLSNHLSQEDMAELNLAHARLTEQLEQWWSLEIGLDRLSPH